MTCSTNYYPTHYEPYFDPKYDDLLNNHQMDKYLNRPIRRRSKNKEMKVIVTRGLDADIRDYNIPEHRINPEKHKIPIDLGTAAFLHAMTGAGKTTMVLNHIIPYALKHELEILYVSNRIAINLQVKLQIAALLGCENKLEGLNDKGLQKLDEIGCVTILTYHSLSSRLKHAEGRESLKKFRILICDEAHFFLSDAGFTGCTGALLQEIPNVFADCFRLYMSATPKSVMPLIAKSEETGIIFAYHWKFSYQHIKPYIFTSKKKLIDIIQSETSGKKWLLFVNWKRDGEYFLERLKNLNIQAKFITADTKKNEPEYFSKILREQKFDERVLTSTKVLDTGITFWDKELRNVVIMTYDETDFMQELGRKRYNQGEQVNLYLYDPPSQIVGYWYKQIVETQDAIKLWENNKTAFLQKHILSRNELFLGGLMDPNPDGSLDLNTLAPIKLEKDAEFLKGLMENHEKTGDSGFVKIALNWLKLKPPSPGEQWLDGRFDGRAEDDLRDFLHRSEGQIQPEQQDEFARNLKWLVQEVYGRNSNDRADREWGATVINNRLKERNLGYILSIDNGVWSLKRTC